MEMLEEHRCFEGWQQRWRHDSSTLNCPMTFSIFLPPPRDHTPPPVLYWLSGLTCNDENFTTKAGAQRVAAELGIVLVMPDTSPRGEKGCQRRWLRFRPGRRLFILMPRNRRGRRITGCMIICAMNYRRWFSRNLMSATAAPLAVTQWVVTVR